MLVSAAVKMQNLLTFSAENFFIKCWISLPWRSNRLGQLDFRDLFEVFGRVPGDEVAVVAAGDQGPVCGNFVR